MSTNVTSLTGNFFPSPQDGFTTTTSGSVASGAATVGLNSVAGFANGEVATFVIDPTDVTKKQTFTGVIDTSGVQVTSVAWTAGTNQTHALGATVVDYATATHIAQMTKGITQEHKQTGAHSDITFDSLTANAGATVDLSESPLTSADIGAVIVNANLGTGAGELGAAWQSWTPTYTGFSVVNGTVVAKYIQIGKSVRVKFKFTAGSSDTFSGAFKVSTPVTAASDITGSDTVTGSIRVRDSSTAAKLNGITFLDSTTTFGFSVNNSTTAVSDVANSTPWTWATGDSLAFTAEYEAA